jgi:hypothetical protein
MNVTYSCWIGGSNGSVFWAEMLVVQREPSVLEEIIAYIFRVEE